TASDTTSGSSTIASIGSATGSSAVPSTGISATTFNTTAYNGMWGYKPSMLNSSPNSNYLPSPTTTATTLNITNCANGRSNGSNTCPDAVDTYTIDLAARLEYTQDSGNYTNTFILTTVGNPIIYTINYTDNTGDSSVNGIPSATVEASTSDTSVTLNNATPTRTGYTFSGWCLGTVSNNGTTCTGTQYSAGESFGIDQTAENTTTLYAVWTPNVYTLTLTNTNATTTGSTAARVTYNSSTVYGGTSGTSGITNPSRSYNFTTFSNAYNNASGAIVSSTANKTYTYGFDGWYTASSGGTRIITSAGALTASTSYTNSSSAWTSTSSPTLYAHWNYGSVTLPTITKTGYDCGWGTSTNTTTKTYGSGATVTSTNAPTTNTALYGVCSVKTNLSLKISFDSGVTSVAVKTGSASGTTVGTVSTSGNTVTGLTYGTAYYLVPTYANGKKLSSWSQDSGAVGTLSSTTAENPTYTIGDGTNAVTLNSQNAATYIQDLTLASCQKNVGTNGNASNVGDIINVVDSRDSKEYTVRYINGACWMTSNLRFTETTLSSSTSNVASTYTDASPYTINQNKSASAWKSLSSDSVCKGSSLDSNNSTYQCMQSGNDNNGNPTVWYNYAGATAGTITGTSNSTAATYDICPKGWHLPAGNSSAAGGINSITSYKDAFSPVYGGYYNLGSLSNATTYGSWWSATASNSTGRYFLYYNNGSLSTSSYYVRYGGFYVRCVRTT
ncbi:InlB B-repeat-containing protein, partial [Candidatus Saccharibacteria bacterium]|nr:InlB B-repeat-containing protein [Candidatus Saccharibacteria bacterium]